MLMITNDDGESSYTLENSSKLERHSGGFCIISTNNERQIWIPDHLIRQAFWVLE